MDKKFIYTTSLSMAEFLRNKGFIQVAQSSTGWTFINDRKKVMEFDKKDNMIFTNKLYG